MKRLRLNQLPDVREGHFLKGILPGKYICDGWMSAKTPGFRTHTGDSPGGSDKHIHDHVEVFVMLQGKAVMELDGKSYPLVTGDVFVVDPGEDHHLVSDVDDPCINLWFNGGDERHPDQKPKS